MFSGRHIKIGTLGEIESIQNKIKTSSRAEILALYRFIFENNGDRVNKEKVWEFIGFNFQDG